MKLMENIDDMINEYKNLQGVEVEQLDSLLEELDKKKQRKTNGNACGLTSMSSPFI